MTSARRWTLAAAALSCATVLTSCGSSAPEGPKLVWSDEFAGAAGAAPDATSWKPVSGGDGWGNGELQCYTDSRENSIVDGKGYLVISARPTPGHACADGKYNEFTSARLITQGLRSFQYGTFEMRAKVPTGVGAWPAFWALGQDHETAGWPASGEIDVTEVLGREPTITHGSVHGPKADGSPFTLTGQRALPADLGTGFHVYSTTWTRDGISFAIDGEEYQRVTRAEVEAQGRWVFDQPFYLLLNVAVGGRWPGPPSASTTWPQQMVVDYVRVYADR
jgi:beta-glucanase (GH16 family)